MSKTPTEIQTSDAGAAVNTPNLAELRRLRERRADLAAELEDLDRRMGFEASPGVKLSRIAAEIAQTIDPHFEHLRETLKTPFEGEVFATEDDIRGALALLLEMADALDGARPWTGIRRAVDALLDEGGLQTRQAAAIDRCESVLKAWRKVQRDYRLERISTDEHRSEEDFLPRALIFALSDIEPGFSRLERVDVKKLLEKARDNASPVTLLFEVMKLAEVWSGTSQDALKKSAQKKRQPGS